MTRRLVELARQGASSTLATGTDVAALVTLAHAGLDPGVAAACAALAGGAVNFTVGRAWVFAAKGSAAPQALAYFTLVVGGGALLSGLAVGAAVAAGAPLLVAKGAAAALVLVAWTWPVARRIFGWSRAASATRPQPRGPAHPSEEAAWVRSS